MIPSSSIRKTFLLSAVSISFFSIAACVWIRYIEIQKKQEPTFAAYYAKGKITGFSVTGQAVGTYEIYRLDNMRGAARKIYSSTGTQLLPPQIQFTNGVLTTTYTSDQASYAPTSPVGMVTTLDADGKIVQLMPTDDASIGDTVLPKVTTQSPDQRYVVTTYLQCARTLKDAPCPTTFGVRVADIMTQKEYTLQPKDFGFDFSNSMKVEVLDYLSSTMALLQTNDAQELYRQKLAILDLSTGQVTTIWKNLLNETDTTGQTLTFQRLQPNKQDVVMRERNTKNDSLTERYVMYNLSTGTITPITQQLLGLQSVLSRDLKGYYYYKEFNQGEWYHDIQHNTDRQITVAGDITNFDPSQRFVPVTRYLTSNGLGEKTVYIQDIVGNTVRTIFHQTVTSMKGMDVNKSPNSSEPKIGDYIYSFIGIQQ